MTEQTEKPKSEQEKTEKSYKAAVNALGAGEDDIEIGDEQQQMAEVDEETSKLQQEVTEVKDQLMRAMAEVENVRRIAKRDIGNAHKYALKPFIESLLPVMDSFEQGMAAFADNQAVVEGMNLTYKLMLDVLQKNGVEQIDPIGKEFDPEYHQAMSMQDDAEAKPNTVLMVAQKGYLLNERVIRTARVIVSKK